ncbi:prepilin-type N-terminal cleavage/methylation domain-containing protein [Bacillus seohaeanensis]|jgi:prepilin-type N-terminal cleavage/methylation domain-containing protein|uniref:Prepilin-type N-terminal cleavage/methylation domain-containing protein n=1 Tax=Bacillus seohaeanensis TaxID=284580 RepID=A0ABW5RSB7_9BACI
MKKSEEGVTLVEVLIALALLSMILLLANSVHLFVQKQMNSQVNKIQVQSDERLAIGLITKEIRKAETVETNHLNELIINETDVYKLKSTTLTKNNEPFISNIKKFTVKKRGNQVTLKIGSLPETIIYLRE